MWMVWRRPSVDDLVEILDISLDEAERILASAKDIVSAREAQPETGDIQPEDTGNSGDESVTSEIPATEVIEENDAAVEETTAEDVEEIQVNNGETAATQEAVETSDEDFDENSNNSNKGSE